MMFFKSGSITCIMKPGGDDKGRMIFFGEFIIARDQFCVKYYFTRMIKRMKSNLLPIFCENRFTTYCSAAKTRDLFKSFMLVRLFHNLINLQGKHINPCHIEQIKTGIGIFSCSVRLLLGFFRKIVCATGSWLSNKARSIRTPQRTA